MKPSLKDAKSNQRSLSEEYDPEIFSRIDVQPRNLRTGSFDNLTSLIWASKRLSATQSVRRKFKKILTTFKDLARSSWISDEKLSTNEHDLDVQHSSSDCPQSIFNKLSSCLMCPQNSIQSCKFHSANFISHHCLNDDRRDSSLSSSSYHGERLSVSLNDITFYQLDDQIMADFGKNCNQLDTPKIVLSCNPNLSSPKISS